MVAFQEYSCPICKSLMDMIGKEEEDEDEEIEEEIKSLFFQKRDTINGKNNDSKFDDDIED